MIGIKSGDSEGPIRIIDDQRLIYLNIQKQGSIKLQWKQQGVEILERKGENELKEKREPEGIVEGGGFW